MTILLTLLRQFWPYLVAFGIGLSSGFGGAWKIQGYRITEAKQEFSAFKLEQQRIFNEATEKANTQREQSEKEYAHLSEILSDEINRGVVFKRCVDAGRCGVLVKPTCAAGIRLPSASGANEASTDAISTTGQPEETLANECAVTTLMLNQLQSDIEKQAGY